MSEFKYAIGDWVCFDDPRVVPGGDMVARPFRVVARVCDECPGGVQRKYSVRGADSKSDVSMVHEFELGPWTEEKQAVWHHRSRAEAIERLSDADLASLGLIVRAEGLKRAKEEAKP